MGPQAQSQPKVMLAHISYTALGKLGTFRIISSAHEIISYHCKQGKTEAMRPSDKGGVERGSSDIPIGAKLLDGCI